MPLPNTTAANAFAQYYYTKVELNAGQLDNLYFGEDEFLNSSAGAGDAGKPIKLNASGQVDASMIAGGSLATHAALTAAHGATGAVVGTTNTQTLTNKTLTSPTISSTGWANANHAHTGSTTGGQLDHGAALTGLTDDDHTQYALLAGRSGGQTLTGGTASGNALTLQSTSNATKGLIAFGTSAYDEVNNRLGIGLTSPSYDVDTYSSAAAVTGIRSRNVSDNASAFALFSLLSGTTDAASGFFAVYHGAYTSSSLRNRFVMGANSDATGIDLRASTTGQDIRIFAGSGTEKARFNTDGLGINQTSIARSLDVVGTIKAATGDATFTTASWAKLVELNEGGIIQWLKSSASISRAIGFTGDGTMYWMRSTANDNSAAVTYDMTLSSGGNLNVTGNITQNSVQVVTTTGTQTLTNKTLTTPIIGTLYGSSSANGDIAIHGTSSATKTTSSVLLQPSGGNVGIGTSSPSEIYKLIVAEGDLVFGIDPDWSGGAECLTLTYDYNLSDYSNWTHFAKAITMNPSTGRLTISGNLLNISTAKTPSSASDTGTTGDIAWDTNYLYVCVGASTWKRAALSTW